MCFELGWRGLGRGVGFHEICMSCKTIMFCHFHKYSFLKVYSVALFVNRKGHNVNLLFCVVHMSHFIRNPKLSSPFSLLTLIMQISKMRLHSEKY